MLADDRFCGRIIGKEGKIIKKLREDTDSKISVSKSVHALAPYSRTRYKQSVLIGLLYTSPFFEIIASSFQSCMVTCVTNLRYLCMISS